MDFFLFCRVVLLIWPYMRFLFVGPELCPSELLALTSGFLQIPPRDGHPCLRLTLPATERVVDFHHQVIAHAGRTKIKKRVNHIFCGIDPFFSSTAQCRASRPFEQVHDLLFSIGEHVFLPGGAALKSRLPVPGTVSASCLRWPVPSGRSILSH